MSIIQDALNKPNKLEENKIAGAISAKKGKVLKPAAIFFYISAAAVFVVYLFTLALFPAARHNAKPGAAAKPPAPTVKPLTAAPVSQAASPGNVFRPRPRFPDFILNGIMQLVDGPRAIINNVIVGIGDVIGGATVEKINKDNVVLKTADSEIMLKMK